MPKINEYVKKPVEIVHELKDEYKIPTFEEFMKDYQADEKVNYDDLNGGSVGEVKGYGPCSDYRCYGSNACQSGETFYDLYIPCPSTYCRNKKNNVKTYWVHDNPGCGYNNDKISNKARIRCPDCFNTSHIKYHNFKCWEHKDDPKETSSMAFGDALFVVYNDEKIPSTVITDILIELQKERARSNW